MSRKFTYRTGPKVIRDVPVASGTVIETGELLKLSSGRAVKMATVTDNLTFIGVAATEHTANDPSGTVGVYLPHPLTVFEYDLDAATDIAIEAELQWNADKKLKASATDQIALAAEAKLQATTILCAFQVPAKYVGDAS